MTSVPGCWDTFGDVVGREFSGWWIGEVHRLVVDSYAVQHPGDGSRQAVQSVGLHLVALHLTLEGSVPHQSVTRALQVGTGGAVTFHALRAPSDPGWRTVLDVVPATSLAEHEALARAWAASVWEAYAPHHDTVRAWAREILARL